MILLNLLISNKEQIDKIINVLLTNKYATNVILGNPEQAHSLNTENVVEHSVIYKLQFATKSLLFSEIEASLAREFPHKEFYIYATPIVQTTTRFFDRIKNSVKALNVLNKKKIDNQ
ncbi:MAG: hypothetical protein V4506_10355 [Bacteroidota bacterium]